MKTPATNWEMRLLSSMAIAILVAILVGFIGNGGHFFSQEDNGTEVLLFPEWKDSSSAFERLVYTNYVVVYSNGLWYTKEKQTNGTLSVFWEGDEGESDIGEAKMNFGLNIKWAVYRALYDSLEERK